MKTNIYTHKAFLDHDSGPGHPERPDRLRAVLSLLDKAPFNTLPVIEAPYVTPGQIARVHDESYIAAMEKKFPHHGYAAADPDTILSPGTREAAWRAAGAVCAAVDDVLNGACDRAFCAVRPPGHHAMPGNAEGFCIFNNIAIGALHARQTRDRVAILDFDVHHGNGSDAVARVHDGLFFASTHQWPLYPGSGLPELNLKNKIVNLTLEAGDGSQAFRAAWADVILPQLKAFDPQLILISAGFDAHRADPLAQIDLTEDDYRWITREIVKIAVEHCGGKIVSVLEGGYDLAALKSSTAAHLSALAAA